MGSSRLKISSDRIMVIAEALYNKGIISYPRTETDCFDDNFQLKPLIEKQIEDSNWGNYAKQLLEGKFKFPRKGKNNDQAHPPIHPVRAAHNLEGEEFKVFDFITRRFLACCSEAAKGHSTAVKIEIAQERFNATGLTVIERNYLDIYTFDSWSSHTIPNFTMREKLMPTKLEMARGTTSRPTMLTEAELIGLMDQSGIGTDATIHEHIKKILDRDYANKEGMYFYPTTLGMSLVAGYEDMNFGFSFSRPELRASVELLIRWKII